MKTIIKYFVRGVISFFTKREFRTFIWMQILYGNRKRFKPAIISFHGHRFEIPDVPSFIWQYKEIFVDKGYEFNIDGDASVILDCGANVGLSVLFFSLNYPSAKILAFEADPSVVEYLRRNISNNKIQNVEVISKAVWINNEDLTFSSEGADGGSIHSSKAGKIKVQAVRLKDVISNFEKIDMMKMDIEGAENYIIPDCREVLSKVKNVFIEYHDFAGEKQNVSAITSALESQGFRYYISNVHKRNKPMQFANSENGMDLQLNIYAIAQK